MNSLRSSASRAWRLLLCVLCLSGASSTNASADFGDPPLLAELIIQSGNGTIGFVNAPLTPAFSSTIYEYEITIPFEHSQVQVASAVPVEDPLGFHTSEVGTIPPLEAGVTTSFTINVWDDPIAPFQVTTYTIHVTRELPNEDAALGSLVVSNTTLTPVFAPLKFVYSGWVSYAVDSVTVTPTSLAPESTITVNGTANPSGSPSSAIPLPVGVTQIVVLVTSGDGEVTKSYTIDITRLETDPDSDNDGLPDAYENANGLTVGIDDTTSDLDGDGLCNVCEYAFGSAPNDPSDHAFPTASRDQDGYLTISFHRAIDPSEGLRYRVEVSSDLSLWQRDVVDLTNSGTPKSQVWRDNNTGQPSSPPTRFIRVRVVAAAP